MSRKPRPYLTIVGPELSWLMEILRTTQGIYNVTIMHSARPLSELCFPEGGVPDCAIVRLSPHDGAADLRELFERAPRCRFVFVADALPIRHAVSSVIRECGHTVIGKAEPSLVIAATAAALMAEASAAR
jgi:hypothetical protein